MNAILMFVENYSIIPYAITTAMLPTYASIHVYKYVSRIYVLCVFYLPYHFVAPEEKYGKKYWDSGCSCIMIGNKCDALY
jgi:hypothetical protein